MIELTLSNGEKFHAKACPICPPGKGENLRVDENETDEAIFDVIECRNCWCSVPVSMWNMRAAEKLPFQARVNPWMHECFGPDIAGDRVERNHRFFEESLELVQASDMTKKDALMLVEYVYGRPKGVHYQEVGGVMVTLAAHCLAHNVDMHAAGETELARIWQNIDKIREKQRNKPRNSPLPIAVPDMEVGPDEMAEVESLGNFTLHSQ